MTEPAAYTKPLPDMSAVAAPFWEGLKQQRLVLQRSRRTGKVIYYPRSVSPYGPGDALEWVECSGRGTVYSFTVARRPTAPQWAEDGPYVIAIVELDEGARVTANIVDCDPSAVRIGMEVQAVYRDVTPDVTLLQFRPA